MGYVHPTGMPVPYWIMVHKPVMPPLASPFGIRNDVQAIQKMNEPTVIRK